MARTSTAKDERGTQFRKWPQLLGFAALYLLSYWSLDCFSFLNAAEKINITPWNPTVAASVILLLLGGMCWMPLLLVAALLNTVVVEHLNFGVNAIAVSLCEAGIYGLAVWVLKAKLKFSANFETLRETVSFCTVMTLAAAIMALSYVLIFYLSGTITLAEVPGLGMEYWAGDALGQLILVPLFMIYYRRYRQPPNHRDVSRKNTLVQMTSVVCLVLGVFFLQNIGINAFYLLFLPVAWIGVMYGISGIPPALFIIQLCIVCLSWKLGVAVPLVIQFFPFFILALCWAGLIIGALVTERETSRLQVVKGDARLRAILDMTPDSMLIVDALGHIVAANQNFAEMYGAPLERISGLDIGDIIPAFDRAANGEGIIKRVDRTTMSVDIAASTTGAAERFSTVLTIRDLTSRKLAESQLRQRRAATEQTARQHVTGGLSAVLAHELNQPLSAIMSYATACHKTLSAFGGTAPRAFEQLDKIILQARRAGDVIRRMREFFQNSSFEAEPVPIADLIEETLVLLDDEITQASVAVHLELPENLRGMIDRGQIEQVLINLIRNSTEALREVPARQRHITLKARQASAQEIEVVVRDTGLGIPAEIADQLFNPFVTTRLSGMGLGLTICQTIIEAHKGRLWSDSQLSSGTAMCFTVPVYGESA